MIAGSLLCNIMVRALLEDMKIAVSGKASPIKLPKTLSTKLVDCVYVFATAPDGLASQSSARRMMTGSSYMKKEWCSFGADQDYSS